MSQEHNESLQMQDSIGLKPQHFADLIRTAQLVFDPTAGLSGRSLKVDWEDFGIPRDVAANLKSLGEEYQYASPHIPAEVVWSKLTTETRIWFIENKDTLWKLEETFPALDED
ncbi:hypothetical protein Cylst_0977 [Cylindrospermum stagnale PCC 7417]|uniref:Excinuclease ATPase subunit n=1 Tax=Cylindrospermum stagnale PCC 7417 TaxID=56107 RepID=K9WU46_9NOST|nr:hypothetical protein [Cylindrospermum stagnale]AFZ23301.1 hypothetical protein Cylst_0977 [Cylindrospermum stagnale PCC 7417]